MTQEDFDKEATIKVSIGHLILLWNLLSDKLSCEPLNKNFTEEEKRAIWALEDLCENELVKHDYGEKPAEEWDALINKAREFCKALPAEFLD